MDEPRKLVEPVIDPVANAIENCELMIEEGIADVLAIRDGGSAARPSHNGTDYDEAYAQGRKDACRVILLSLRGREHVTSDDPPTERRT